MLWLTDDNEKEFPMRRTMQALFVLAIFTAPAMAQSESLVVGSSIPHAAPAACTSGCSNHGSGPIYPSAYGCGNGTGSQLAAYMNSFPTHPNLWDSYPAQYDARLNCLFKHVDGCNCLDPKRNLHTHPSLVCQKGGSGCEGGSTQATDKGFSKLYTSPTAVIPSDSVVGRIFGTKPVIPPPAGAAPATPTPAKTANAGIKVNTPR